MFRSIFAKYVTAFAGLLLCGFLMLLLVFGSVVGSYAERTKQAVIRGTTQSAVEDLSEMKCTGTAAQRISLSIYGNTVGRCSVF